MSNKNKDDMVVENRTMTLAEAEKFYGGLLDQCDPIDKSLIRSIRERWDRGDRSREIMKEINDLWCYLHLR